MLLYFPPMFIIHCHYEIASQYLAMEVFTLDHIKKLGRNLRASSDSWTAQYWAWPKNPGGLKIAAIYTDSKIT